ncbi:hypothetical protein CANTEDRAFT_128887 [Yamadazyma tenuis ATCC 10573]|uniref:Uncharacterized protein n=1 Tax=Candida tenuis (strain ATCC 10573 / BCRC 21748 / CBS 615 / JCM 9827 / NBRC 10315 / NRRL Y-1498 / VKM Y-70) TaxID=590646 RepID=G3AW85_CANTC|nr:uncharacterized protein CANTEDRAFT_128887 [Yamadazyma tenuis ATCC 10573]EGV66481.1 hypothetical protein CANTEDRAFT_128887 [Yamadazyma tenuis ATCC 10573]
MNMGQSQWSGPTGQPQGIPQTQPLSAPTVSQPVINSPMMNNPSSSPIMGQSASANANARAKGKRASTSSQAGRKKSTKGGAPTPGASATTPASLANAIRTPNSIPTPQVPTSQSNKNTPGDNNQSPNFQNKISGGKLNEHAIGDIFSSIDENESQVFELNKRKEMSDQDPEKFFFASLANLVEFDDSSDLKGLPTPSPSVNGKSSISSIKSLNGNSTLRTPSSPSTEWTATIKPEAIVTSFKQVSSIKEAVSMEILDVCAEIAGGVAGTDKSSGLLNGLGLKREREEEEDDLDFLFTEEKKFKPESDDTFNFLYSENLDFNQWKSHIISQGP